jgi:hypothetical protein
MPSDSAVSIFCVSVAIANYHAGEDTLLFSGKTFDQIFSAYGVLAQCDVVAGKLFLNGLAPTANYNSVLDLLQYDNLQTNELAVGGDHAITVIAQDLAGNLSAALAAVTIRVGSSAAADFVFATVDSTPVTHKITPTPTIGTDSHYDIALMTGSDQTISLGQLSSVEKIDLTGTGANKLTVALADVLQITTGNTALQNANIALKVVGDLGDTVDLVNSANDHWSKTGQITNAGEVFNVYHNDASTNLLADLWVKEVVQVNVV